MLVEDAKGQPPNIPFWFGEVPGRDDLLSAGVSELRTGIGERLEAGGDQARTWLLDAYGLPPAAADQLLTYYGVPTQDRIVLERFWPKRSSAPVPTPFSTTLPHPGYPHPGTDRRRAGRTPRPSGPGRRSGHRGWLSPACAP